MPNSWRGIFFNGLILFLTSVPLFSADTPQTGRNSDPTYQQLRNLTLSGEAASLKSFDLRRDATTFHLHSGTVCFVAPVQGKVTGAVFVGDGNLIIDPPAVSERSMLKLLTKQDEFNENFNQLVIRFTDDTYEELKKAGGAPSGGCDPNLVKSSQRLTRHQFGYNLESRILEDLLSPASGGLFIAFIYGKRYSDKELLSD